MVDLSIKRVDQILHEETPRTEVLPTILRSVYVRYMRLYESYFADIDALNDEKIDALNKDLEETNSLVKYYYMDIPHDIILALYEFDKQYNAKLLGPDWAKNLSESFEEFKEDNEDSEKCEKCLKAKFARKNLDDFYDAMDTVFRDGFGTGSKTAEKISGGLMDMLFKD